MEIERNGKSRNDSGRCDSQALTHWRREVEGHVKSGSGGGRARPWSRGTRRPGVGLRLTEPWAEACCHTEGDGDP